MSRRSPRAWEQRIQRSLGAMAPGGRLASESPVRRAPGTLRPPRVSGGGAEAMEYMADSLGWSSAEPPYPSWVIQWTTDVLPPDLIGTAFLRLTLDQVGATSTIDVIVPCGTDPWPDGYDQTFTISGGPFISGQTVETASFLVQTSGYRGEATILNADPGATTPGFTTSACALVMEA